jgi:hypothetical protein
MQRPHWDLIILHRDTAKDTFFFLKMEDDLILYIEKMHTIFFINLFNKELTKRIYI